MKRRIVHLEPGDVFTRLTLVRKVHIYGNSNISWVVKCICGKVRTVQQSNLREGRTKSCGCLHSETSRETGLRNRRHGQTRTPTWRTWQSILTRCLNPNSKDYKRYGARGIRICRRWLKFENFLADMGERPPGRSIDRFPNQKGNYKPGNCRWATTKQQGNNRYTNVLITFKGKTLNIAEWAPIVGIKYQTLHKRISRGDSPIKALTRPVRDWGR
jgi:hypothetical protein